MRCRPLDQRGANPTAAAVRSQPRCQRADTSPCPLLTGEGSPRCPRLVRRQVTYPRPARIPHTPLAHHPNGAANRRCASGWVKGRRLRVESRSTPGRLRGTALGVLRPLCEELAGTVASHHAFVPCRTARQPDEGNWRLGLAAEAGFRPDKRGPEPKIAEGGAPGDVRRVAQSRRAATWLNGCGPLPKRPAALRQPRSITDAATAGGGGRSPPSPQGDGP